MGCYCLTAICQHCAGIWPLSSADFLIQTELHRIITHSDVQNILGLYSLDVLPPNLAKTQSPVKMIVSPCNLTGICQISARLVKFKPESRGFETSVCVVNECPGHHKDNACNWRFLVSTISLVLFGIILKAIELSHSRHSTC